MCKSALLFTKKDYSLSEAIKIICREKRVNLSYCLTFPELLNNIINSNPEIVFYDMENVKFSYELYKEFADSKIFYLPRIVLLTNNPESLNIVDSNIAIVDRKNFTDKLFNEISSVTEKQIKKLAQDKINEIKIKTTKILAELGITTKYIGYEYIRELVVQVAEDKRLVQSFNKKLYPKLAMKYNTPINNVERNIRNAINVASLRSKNKMLFDEISGRTSLTGANPIPSNKQFITWIVDKVS